MNLKGSRVPARQQSYPHSQLPSINFKIVFLGDLGVGKSSLVNRCVLDTLDAQSTPTLGIDFLTKTLYFLQRTVKLNFWDTAGQERFKSLIPIYLRRTAVAVIVFDVTSRKSFSSCKNELKILQEHVSCRQIYLLGNKVDLKKREVPQAQAVRFAIDNGLCYFQVSAYSGLNMDKFYDRLLEKLLIQVMATQDCCQKSHWKACGVRKEIAKNESCRC